MVVCQMAKLCIILGVFVSELWGGIFCLLALFLFFFLFLLFNTYLFDSDFVLLSSP